MGNSFIENSLKRWLKRKVKVTLGLMVTFMITGTVGFATNDMNENDINNHKEISKLWLEGLGENISIKGNDISFEDNEIIKISSLKDYTLNISNLVLKNLENSLILGEQATTGNYTKDINLSNDENNYFTGLQLVGTSNLSVKGNEISVIEKGTIVSEKQYGEENSSLVNKGIIKNQGDFGQHLDSETAKAYNYGVIANTKKNGQYIGYKGDYSQAYNYGIIVNSGMNGQETNGKGSSIYNYGIIKNNGWYGQGTKNTDLNDEVKIYNYGIIANTANGQYTQGSVGNDELYNFGLIINTGDNGQISESKNSDENSNGKLYNYGLIANNGKGGQVAGKFTELYNYGVIANNKNNGQIINDDKSIAYNFGIIKNNGSEGQAILTDEKSEIETEIYNYGLIANNGTAYNYGIIANKENYGQIASFNGNIYNYGIVANKGDFAMATDNNSSSQGFNYGVVYKENTKIFEQDIINKGIVIVKNVGEKESISLGNHIEGVVISGENFELLKDREAQGINENVYEIETDNSTLDNNIFKDTPEKTVIYAKDKNIKITENLSEINLNTVLTSTSDKEVILSSDNDLTIKDTSIIGYFEKNGTLLEVNGDLTLEGESVINAIAGNEYTGYTGETLDDVVAVKLAENGTLTIGDNSKVLGAVKGNGILVYKNNKENHLNSQKVDSTIIKTTANNTTDITLANLTLTDSNKNVDNAGKLIIDNQSSEKLENKEISTSITLANNIDIEKGIDGSNSTNGFELILGDGQISSDDTIKIGGEILLGQSDDTLVINNNLKEIGEINGNTGNDTVILKNLNGKHDTFDYQLKNIDTLDLNNQSWKIGANASIEFGNSDTTTKVNDKITIQNGTLMGELQGNSEIGVEFVNNGAVNKVIGNATIFGDNAKFQMNIGKDMKLEAGAEYDLNVSDETLNTFGELAKNNKVTASGIFKKATEDNSKEIRVKTAEEMKINERYSGIYDEMLKNASSNDEILNILNSSDVSSITNAINGKGALGDTLATTGYKITRDISNHFISAVNEWDKKAGKGEWLANAKYINSDMEYDGANSVKGYDSDINSMVGMIEYGVSENTAYGIALGGGDTEIDVDNAGTLKGDNYYIGAYAKHSINGFDLVGNVGYTISELEVNGEGSADSTAITLGGYIKRDVKLTDTIKLEPNLLFTYDYIMQDNAEGNGVKVDNKDIHVFEASAGMNIVKEFAFETGKLDLKAGVKYSMADVNRNEETVISVLGINDINLGNPEIDDTKGTAHVGFDYEHETGFGFNGKYEMMWSDSGDDSRITAGVSYRF